MFWGSIHPNRTSSWSQYEGRILAMRYGDSIAKNEVEGLFEKTWADGDGQEAHDVHSARHLRSLPLLMETRQCP